MHRYRPIAGLLIGASILFAGAAPVSAQAASSTPATWTPSAAALKRLGPAVKIGPLSFQPPIGYTESMTSFNDYPALVWSLPKTPGPGFPPYIQFVAATPYEKDSYETVDLVAGALVSDLHKRYTAWTQSAPEHGSVNGLPFVRIYWHGTDSHTKIEYRGFDYVTRQKQSFLEFMSLQAQPDPQGLLAISEASVLTARPAAK